MQQCLHDVCVPSPLSLSSRFRRGPEGFELTELSWGPLPALLFPDSLAPQMVTAWNCELFFQWLAVNEASYLSQGIPCWYQMDTRTQVYGPGDK